MSDNYGGFVNKYEIYTESRNMEYVLGRKIGLNAAMNVISERRIGETGWDILDVGSGPGTNGPELQQMGARVVGIDKDRNEIERARQLDPGSIYIHYDGLHLADAVEGRQFDAILASFSICTIEDAVLRPILRDMSQLLAPGGKIVMIEPNLEKALGTQYHDLHYHAQPGVKSGDHVHVTLGTGKNAVELYHDIYRLHRDYFRLLEEAGFTVTSFKQPRPRGWDLLRWWKAAIWPPFLIIEAR